MTAEPDIVDTDMRPAGRRSTVRGQMRQQAREPGREAARGGLVIEGHNGEMLSRKRKSGGDMFEIPKDLIPKGWEYQWCAISVVGNSEVLMDQNLMFAENGWRPVPSERHDGRFMPVGHKGHIIRGGQMLMERPKALCDEARYEDQRIALQQMRDRDQALMGGRANLGAATHNQGIPVRGTGDRAGNAIRMNIDPALDIPTPSHPLADPEA